MNNQSILKDISILPLNAQREVIDFIDFLKTRYATESKDQKKALSATPIEDEIFIGMWHNRKDLEDSSEWVKKSERIRLLQKS